MDFSCGLYLGRDLDGLDLGWIWTIWADWIWADCDFWVDFAAQVW